MGKRSNSKLGDTRLEKGFTKLVKSMCNRHTVVLNQLGNDLNEKTQYWRFINNKRLSPDKLLTHYWSESTVNFTGKDILVIGDSSTMSFKPSLNREELGYVGPKTKKEGFALHACIMIDANHGGCYGIGSVSYHKNRKTKNEADQEKKVKRRKNVWKLPFEQKERYKWFSGPKKAIANCPGANRYTLLGDRESDIYDLIARTLQNQWHFLYRSKENRLLAPSVSQKTLHDFIEHLPIRGTYDLELKKTKKRSAHSAKMVLKYGKTTINRPNNNKDRRLPEQIELYVVEVKEDPQSVIGNEKPVHWILLTSHPINSLDDAMQIITWYRWRWIIEQVFRTLKSQGLDIESSEVETYHALKNLTTLATIAALQVMQLVRAREENIVQKMNQVFLRTEQNVIHLLNQKLEGNTKKSKNPHPPDSLAFAAWVIARLGGWSGYAKQKPPGPITMTNGFNRFFTILEGYYLIL